MKKELTIKKTETLVVDVEFPMYLRPNDYSVMVLLNEERYIKASIVEKYRYIGDETPPQYSVWLSSMDDKHDVNAQLELFYSGKVEKISPLDFDAFYFRAKKLISEQFNLLDSDALPE